MTKLWAFVRHNSGICIGVPMCICVLIWCYSCQSTVVSLARPGERITRPELVAEVDTMLAKAEAKFSDLDRQDLVKETIFNSVLDLASGGTVNPLGVFLALGNIIGLGAVVDNVRKRTHINTLKGDYVNAKAKETVREIINPKPN